jgi:general stress protein 26
MEVASFEDIREEMMSRVQRIVWATVATVDTRGRPRQRILHPVWEGTTAWICTGRNTLKTKHLAANPNVSVTYWDPEHRQVYIEGTAEWEDDPAEKRRVWDLFKSHPFPYGYDPSIIAGWTSPDAPAFGILKVTPRRIELSGMGPTVAAVPLLVWHAKR